MVCVCERDGVCLCVKLNDREGTGIGGKSLSQGGGESPENKK